MPVQIQPQRIFQIHAPNGLPPMAVSYFRFTEVEYDV